MRYEFKTVKSEEYGYVVQVIHQNRQVVAECRNKEMAKRVAKGLELEYKQRKEKDSLDKIDDRLALLEQLTRDTMDIASKAFYGNQK